MKMEAHSAWNIPPSQFQDLRARLSTVSGASLSLSDPAGTAPKFVPEATVLPRGRLPAARHAQQARGRCPSSAPAEAAVSEAAPTGCPAPGDTAPEAGKPAARPPRFWTPGRKARDHKARPGDRRGPSAAPAPSAQGGTATWPLEPDGGVPQDGPAVRLPPPGPQSAAALGQWLSRPRPARSDRCPSGAPGPTLPPPRAHLQVAALRPAPLRGGPREAQARPQHTPSGPRRRLPPIRPRAPAGSGVTRFRGRGSEQPRRGPGPRAEEAAFRPGQPWRRERVNATECPGPPRPRGACARLGERLSPPRVAAPGGAAPPAAPGAREPLPARVVAPARAGSPAFPGLPSGSRSAAPRGLVPFLGRASPTTITFSS
ncbi:basic proline-rich protein-like [Felis catus]|uniref:basic proline-rich protein-like n=1 Tax=Felis catus TaxID=9685 RepID=UPI001D19EB39|nr:basic proline-rich protein-like [Felis catus]